MRLTNFFNVKRDGQNISQKRPKSSSEVTEVQQTRSRRRLIPDDKPSLRQTESEKPEPIVSETRTLRTRLDNVS